MMYADKLAVAIKIGKNVLREFERDKVYLPFSSEYSIYIKNLNTVRALVKIFIDGTEVTKGLSLVVHPNEPLELERFVKSNNLNAGNKFKFIERNAAVERGRGVKAEDGLVRVEYQFERLDPIKPAVLPDHWKDDWDDKPWVSPPWNPNPWPKPHWPKPHWGPTYMNNVRGVGGSSASASLSSNSVGSAYGARSWTKSASKNDVGITAPGSYSDQAFQMVSGFPVESQTHVLILHLLGEREQKKVVETVTTRTKLTCRTCKSQNKSTAKFCSECGTSLIIVEPTKLTLAQRRKLHGFTNRNNR